MDMQKFFEKYKKEVDGKNAVGVLDMSTGFTFLKNESRQFMAASLGKLFIVGAIFEKVASGKLSLNKSYKISFKEKVGGSGIIHLTLGRNFTLYDLCLLAIIESDNTAANKLIDIVGGLEVVNLYIKNLGLKKTRITHKFMLHNDEGPSLTTVTDLLIFFRLLSEKKLPLSNKFKNILLEQKSRFRTSTYIKTLYGFKTADLPHPDAVVHDAGIIYDTEGDIIIIFLNEGVSNRKKTMFAMADIAKEVYSFIVFNERLRRKIPKTNFLILPTEAKYDNYTFGKKVSNWGRHLGVDFRAKAGTKVFAVAPGKVVYSALHLGSIKKRNYGNVMIIAHNLNGKVVHSLYGHLGNRLKKVGDTVFSGDVIGIIGAKNTPENGYWPDHLHFGLYKGLFRGSVLPGYSPPGKMNEWLDPKKVLIEKFKKTTERI